MSDGSNDGNSGFVVFSESCDRYVKQYRAGEITFPAAVGEITRTFVAGERMLPISTRRFRHISEVSRKSIVTETKRERVDDAGRLSLGRWATWPPVRGERLFDRASGLKNDGMQHLPMRRGGRWADEAGAEGRAGEEPMFAWLSNAFVVDYGGETSFDEKVEVVAARGYRTDAPYPYAPA
jgi:hypothetical protein